MKNNQLKLLTDQEYMERYFDSKIGNFFGEDKKSVELKIKKCRTFSDLTTAIKYTLTVENNKGEKTNYQIRGSASSEDEFIQMRAKSYRLMKAMFKNKKFQGNLTLPRPIAFDEELGLLLYLEVSGTTLRHFLRTEPNIKEKIKFIKLTAEWLANLHSFDYTLTEKQDEEFLQTKIAIFKTAFLRHWQERYSEIEKLLDKILEERLLIYDPDLFVLGHGDFTPSNIIIQRRHNLVAALDFIDAAMADPVYDLAVFFVQIEDLAIWGYLNFEASKNLKKAFIDQYQKSIHWLADWPRKLNVHQAFNAMQVAKFTVEAVPWIDERNRAANQLIEYAYRCINEKEEIII